MLTNLKTRGAICLLIPFSNIKKRHTYKSQNTPFYTTNNNSFKGNNLHINLHIDLYKSISIK